MPVYAYFHFVSSPCVKPLSRFYAFGEKEWFVTCRVTSRKDPDWPCGATTDVRASNLFCKRRTERGTGRLIYSAPFDIQSLPLES